MTQAQRRTRLAALQERLRELAHKDNLDDAEQAEWSRIESEAANLRVLIAAGDDDELAAVAAAEREVEMGGAGTPETREQRALRSRARAFNYFEARMDGRVLDGAEAEYNKALGVPSGNIPLDLFEGSRQVRPARADAVSTIPSSGTGVNVQPIQPAVYADSIAAMLGIAMPRVPSGGYSEMRVDDDAAAAPKAVGEALDATAVTLAAVTTNPRRIVARVAYPMETIAQMGAAYEAPIRQNAMAALADAYDNQCVNGDGAGANVNGLLAQLSNPTDPTAIANFDAFVAAFIDQVDGLWARTGADVRIVANPETYRLSAKAFRDIPNTDLGSEAFSDYAMAHFGGWSCNSRMPDTASHIAKGIAYRMGRPGLRTASHPVWSSIAITDVYSGAASGVVNFTMTHLVGDRVVVVQPDAYRAVEFKVSASS